MLEWFKSLEDKNRSTFIQFDIVQFYPSISEELLGKAIDWAKTHVELNDSEKNIIMSTKQNLLFWNGEAWEKKSGGNCDITMGSWDGAECSDLVGLYLLSQLKTLGVNLGLYRNDGLGAPTSGANQETNL